MSVNCIKAQISKNTYFFSCYSGRFLNTPGGPQKSYDELKNLRNERISTSTYCQITSWSFNSR